MSFTITNPLPYFVLSACMIGLAGRLARILPPDSRKLNVPLESLRGLLAMSVMFSHVVVSYFYFQTGKWDHPPSHFYASLGSEAVILFFFLSGFLFWSKCIANNGIGGYKSFLLARMRRLVPAYYVSVGLVLLVVFASTHFKLNVPLETLVVQLALLLLFLPTSNINGFKDAFYINAGVIWTLLFEIAFYLLLPILFWFFKGWRIFLYIALAFGVYGALVLHGVSFTSVPDTNYDAGLVHILFLNSFFGFGFGLGALVAFLYARCPQYWKRILQQRRWTPIPLLFLAAPILLKTYFYSPASFLLLIVVFIFVAAGNDFFGLLSSRAVLLLGSISYSFYITHGIVLFVLLHLLNLRVAIAALTPLQYWVFIGVVGLTAVCFSALLYWTVERRFMKRSSATIMSTHI